MDPIMPTNGDGWSNFLLLFASSEEAVFAGVRINPAHADPRLFNSRLPHCSVAPSNRSLDQARLDLGHGIEQPDMRCNMNNPQFRSHQEHRYLRSVGKRSEQLSMTGKLVPSCIHCFLASRSRT